MAAPTPSPPPKLDLPGTCRRRRDGTAFPPPLAGFPLPLPHLFSGLAKKLFTNRLVSAIIIPLSQVRAGGSMDRASDSGSEGWGFESLLAYHEMYPTQEFQFLCWVFLFRATNNATKNSSLSLEFLGRDRASRTCHRHVLCGSTSGVPAGE